MMPGGGATGYCAVMTEEHRPAAPPAPFSIVAISALLWSQGGIWAVLGAVSLYCARWLPDSEVITAVLFGFAVLAWVLAVALPWRGGERARTWVIAHETFIALVGLAILGISLFALDGLLLIAPIGLFVVAGIFMAACAAAALVSGSARDFCRQRAAL
jgi:hypothetical protein